MRVGADRRGLLGAALALGMIGLTSFYLGHMQRSHRLGAAGVKIVGVPVLNERSEVARTNSVFLPSDVPGWTVTSLPISELELNYLPKDTTYARRRYEHRASGVSMQATVVLMGTDRTSIHRPEYCLSGQGWGIERRTFATVSMEKPRRYDLAVRRFDSTGVTTKTGRPETVKGVYVFWFVTDGLLTADHRERMWWMARDLLTRGVLQRWAYVSCFVECAPGQEEASFEKIQEWIRAAAPEFQLTHGGVEAAGK